VVLLAPPLWLLLLLLPQRRQRRCALLRRQRWRRLLGQGPAGHEGVLLGGAQQPRLG
jgi:hypothetical protein